MASQGTGLGLSISKAYEMGGDKRKKRKVQHFTPPYPKMNYKMLLIKIIGLKN
jgi:hypothetical protein